MTPLSQTAGSSSKPSKVKDAAEQFEGLMIAQMLQSARESSKLSGPDDDGDGGSASSQSSTMYEYADQQFAQMLAHQGGIGLSRLAEANLNKSS